MRTKLGINADSEVLDLSGTCCCHNKQIKVGYACSICLALFCAPMPICPKCRFIIYLFSFRSRFILPVTLTDKK